MTEKKIAVVGEVIALHLIEGADRIVRAEVDCADAGKWSGVVGLNVKQGERVLVFLQDALLPPNDDRWAFMEKHKWRVRMARFRGVPSECLIVSGAPDLPAGSDVSEILGVTTYEKPIPAAMSGDAVGAFPGHIPKTDETNFQAAPEIVERMHREPWYATEKADGTSCTAWNDDDGMHVCSRNWELREFTAAGAGNAYWRAARKYGLERLPAGLAIQFEVVGPGIQGNPMGLPDLEVRAFTLRDTRAHCDMPRLELERVCAELGIPMARLIGTASNLHHHASHINGHGMPVFTAEELRKLAEIKYPNGKPGEGIVIRALDSSWSFKVINLLYKD
jgi:RNA ligase (TIGR02306 family)